MPFDTQTRNRLARFVTEGRELLADEFAQQLQSIYGVTNGGVVTPLTDLNDLGEEQQALAELLRDRLEYLKASSSTERNPAAAAVGRLKREQAFTVLNRLAAIRMAERRGFIVESVGRAYQSKGFQVYSQVAGGGLGETYHRYRQYLFCLFDELSLDLGALFDRRSPASLLFPREPVLLALLELLNAHDIDQLWGEDETIGWIYQYYNDEGERKRMRESGVPRNSRELAVRNQFFTPRYVVEFLVDNTLGRVWYEATGGSTSLKDRCQYLLQRPQEVIAGRPMKDPRELRLLDPACGSMHFGLYAFDLFETIYEEAWDLGDRVKLHSAEHLPPLRSCYSSKDAFRRAIPKLIIEHNIHGIDIDPRAVQIASLSLWLRAQRSWQSQNVPIPERPRIGRTQIVCAEPMPGKPDLLGRFTDQLKPLLLGQLVRKIFDKMQLAGEAGSLLKIEREISEVVRDSKRKWQDAPQAEQAVLFGAAATDDQASEVVRASITDEQFFDTAERRIYDSLHSYAQRLDADYNQRLFAGDTARGFAFIDLCRKHYDVVLMNPPFGPAAETSIDYLASAFPDSKHDLALCAVDRARELLTEDGIIGAIITRTPLFLPTSFKWREQNLLGRCAVLQVLSDFGVGVLDATVESAAFTIRPSADQEISADSTLFVRTIDSEQKAQQLLTSISEFAHGTVRVPAYLVRLKDFYDIPFAPLSYWTPASIRRVFREFSPFQNDQRDAKCGLGTLDDFRFLRLVWEIRPTTSSASRWVNYADGGTFTPFYQSSSAIVNWNSDGEEIKQFVTQKVGSASRKVQGASFYFQKGLTFPRRTKRFCPRPLPSGSIFSTAGQAIFLPSEDELMSALGLLSSDVCKYFISLSLGTNSQDQGGTNPQFEVGIIKRLPWPDDAHDQQLVNIVNTCIRNKMRFESLFEESRLFRRPLLDIADSGTLTNHHAQIAAAAEALTLQLRSSVDELNRIAAAKYGLSNDDLELLKRDLCAAGDMDIPAPSKKELCESLVSWLVGCAFGRWDVRLLMSGAALPDVPAPFDKLALWHPAQLRNGDGLPVIKEELMGRETADSSQYPVDIPWGGVLVDDPTHPMDLERRIHGILQILWHKHSEAVEHEICDALGVTKLADYLRRPTGFFSEHLRRYSGNRRQAPIYWPLSTASGKYILWVYYPRLTTQTLHTCLADFIDPKLKNVSAEIDAIRRSNIPNQRLADLQELSDELMDMRMEVERIIKLPYIPRHDDGVQISAAALWKLFRLPRWHKDLKACWEELQRGDFDWAHIALSIWPDRVKNRCKGDRSIAIAHNLQELCEVKQPQARSKKARVIQTSLVDEGAR